MDMDVLLQPPILYIGCVMIWWGVLFVPFALEQHDHFMVLTGAVLHGIVYAWLLSLSVPGESCISIISASFILLMIFTGGGYLLSYVRNSKHKNARITKSQVTAHEADIRI